MYFLCSPAFLSLFLHLSFIYNMESTTQQVATVEQAVELGLREDEFEMVKGLSTLVKIPPPLPLVLAVFSEMEELEIVKGLLYLV